MSNTFQPTDKQSLALRMAFTDGVDEILYGGARGGGKTIFDAAFILEYAIRYPGSRGLVVRQDLVDLRRTTLKEFKEFIARYYPELPVRWNMSSPITCWITTDPTKPPTEVAWGDTKDPDSYRSENLNFVVIDEASEVSHEFYLIIRATLGRYILQDGTRPPKRLIATTNPGPGWCKDGFPVGHTVKKRTVDLTMDNGETEYLRRVFIPAKPKDNPNLPRTFEAELRATYPEIWVKKWLEGDWDAFEGMVFTEFDEDRHVLRFAPDRGKMADTGWRHVVGADWGFRNPAAAVCCSIDYDGEWWVWDEYYGKERTPEQTKPYLKALVDGVRWDAQLMDYAATDQSTGTSIMSMFNAMGFHFQPCSKRKHGADGSIMFLKKLLAENMIHISPVCQNLIRELKSARWQPLPINQVNDKSDPEKMVDKDDHAIDALFYAFEFWRSKPVEQGLIPADSHESRMQRNAQLSTEDAENRKRLQKLIESSDKNLTHKNHGAIYFDEFGEITS